jgi:nucleosome binding factor SPN SPT16 subunit
LNSKNTKELQRDMIFSVSVGFQDIDNPKAEDEQSKKYAYFLFL